MPFNNNPLNHSGSSGVQSVNGRSGAVDIIKPDVINKDIINEPENFIWVAKNGSDSIDNKGTYSDPFLTITHAIAIGEKRGSTVHIAIAKGAYMEDINVVNSTVVLIGSQAGTSLHSNITCTSGIYFINLFFNPPQNSDTINFQGAPQRSTVFNFDSCNLGATHIKFFNMYLATIRFNNTSILCLGKGSFDVRYNDSTPCMFFNMYFKNCDLKVQKLNMSGITTEISIENCNNINTINHIHGQLIFSGHNTLEVAMGNNLSTPLIESTGVKSRDYIKIKGFLDFWDFKRNAYGFINKTGSCEMYIPNIKYDASKSTLKGTIIKYAT